MTKVDEIESIKKYALPHKDRVVGRVSLPRSHKCSCGICHTHSELVSCETQLGLWFMCECGSSNIVLRKVGK